MSNTAMATWLPAGLVAASQASHAAVPSVRSLFLLGSSLKFSSAFSVGFILTTSNFGKARSSYPQHTFWLSGQEICVAFLFIYLFFLIEKKKKRVGGRKPLCFCLFLPVNPARKYPLPATWRQVRSSCSSSSSWSWAELWPVPCCLVSSAHP